MAVMWRLGGVRLHAGPHVPSPACPSLAAGERPRADERGQSGGTDGDIQGIQGADTARFDTLFERFERQVYGYLYRVLGDRQVAADLCQETFLRAWRHRERVAEYSEPLGWLLRVATNLALNHRRHGRTRVGVPVALSEENSPALGDPAPEVVEHLQVHQVLLALPANMRAALVLREVYGLELDEVARTLGISHGAAKMLLSRARERFRERYRREEGRE